MITLTTQHKFITFITIRKIVQWKVNHEADTCGLQKLRVSHDQWSDLPRKDFRDATRSLNQKRPWAPTDNLQRLRIDISTNAWSHVDWPPKTEPVSLRIRLKRSQPQIWLFLHQWSIIFKYLICISHFSLLSSPLVILLPLPSAVELQDSSPLDLSFHRTCILEISILGTPTALRRTLSVHGAPVEGHQDRKDLFFIGCRKDKKL